MSPAAVAYEYRLATEPPAERHLRLVPSEDSGAEPQASLRLASPGTEGVSASAPEQLVLAEQPRVRELWG